MAEPIKSSSYDDLIKKGKLLQQKSQGSSQKPQVAPATSQDKSAVDAVIQEAKDLADTVKDINVSLKDAKETFDNTRQAVGGARDFIRDNIAGPIWTVIGPVVRTAGRAAKWVWDHVAYTKDADGKRVLSRKKAGVLLTVAFTAAASLTNTMVGNFAWENMYEPMWDGARMATTLRHEKVYLSDTNEINPARNIHSVKGCKSLNCGEADSVYYRVQPSWMNHAWSLATKGTPFIPDLVVGPIRPGINKCDVTVYGARMPIFRYFQWYPIMLDAKCEVITPAFNAAAMSENNIKSAVDHIVKEMKSDAYVSAKPVTPPPFMATQP